MKKKLFTLMTLLLCLCSGAWAEDATWTYTFVSGDQTTINNNSNSGTFNGKTWTVAYSGYTGSSGDPTLGWSNSALKVPTSNNVEYVTFTTTGFAGKKIKEVIINEKNGSSGTTKGALLNVLIDGVALTPETGNVTSLVNTTTRTNMNVTSTSGTNCNNSLQIKLTQNGNSSNYIQFQVQSITVKYELAAPASPIFSPNGGNVLGNSSVNITCNAEKVYYQWSDTEVELTTSSTGWIEGTTTDVPNVTGTRYLYAYASNAASYNSGVVHRTFSISETSPVNVTWLPNDMTSKTATGTANEEDILSVSDLVTSTPITFVEDLENYDSKKWGQFTSTNRPDKNKIATTDYITFTVTVDDDVTFIPKTATAYCVGIGTGNNAAGIYSTTQSTSITSVADNSSAAATTVAKSVNLSGIYTAGQTVTFYIYIGQNNTTTNKGIAIRDVILSGYYLKESGETFDVTYKANGSGEDDVEHNVAKVESNMFTWAGHAFTGWNTESDGSGDDYAIGDAVTTDLTLWAQWETATYTVTIAKNENSYGTVTSESVADVAYNTTVSATDNVLSVGTTDITATPAAATAEYTYAFNNWTGIPEGGKVTEDATVTANFTRTPVSYNLAWDANGDGATLSGNYTQGSTAFGTNITKPTATREGYVLLGWSTTPNGDIVNITTMPAETTTYFAQWGDIPNVYYYKNNYSDNSYKNPEGGDASGQDNVVLTTPWTIDNGTITGVTSVIATNAVYDNKSNHMNSYIKLRPADSGKITFTVASGYKATIKIKMGGYSGANTNITMKLNDAGDNISYTGTMSGAATSEDGYALLTYSNLLGGAYTLKPTSGSLYISEINVTTEENTVPATISAAEYATFCNASYALDFSETGITVYTAEDKETSVGLNEVTSGKVPANTPVVLYKASANGTAIDVPVIASAPAIEGTNDLRVSTGTDVDYMYVLAKKNNKVGFYKWAGSTNLSAGKIYLQGKASYGAREFLGFEGTTTGISNVDVNDNIDANAPMYNLAGQKVSKSYKGIVVVNGKKVVRK